MPPLVVLFRFTPGLFVGPVFVFPLHRQCLYQVKRLPQREPFLKVAVGA